MRRLDVSAMFCRASSSSIARQTSSFAPQLAIRRSLSPRHNQALFRMASTLPKLPIFEAIARHDPNIPAIIHSSSQRTFTYGSLLHDVAAAKDHLSKAANGQSLRGERIAFLAENGYDYVGASYSQSQDTSSINKVPSNIPFHPRTQCRCPASKPGLPEL